MKKIVLVAFVPALFVACFSREPVNVVISDREFVLDEQEVEFRCPPLPGRVRKGKDAQIWIMVKEKWDGASTQDQILQQSGKATGITGILVGDDGTQYTSSMIGSAVPSVIGWASENDGQFITIRFFPQMPQTVKIRSVRLKGSSPILVERVGLFNFDPL